MSAVSAPRRTLSPRSVRPTPADGSQVRFAPHDSRSRVRGVWKSARPHQWIKNGLVAVAPLAAGQLTSSATIVRITIAVASMCLAASGTYLLNDVADAAADRIHPIKRLRPVAAGVVCQRTASVGGVVLLISALVVAATLGWGFAAVVGLYVALTVSYTRWLKHVPIVDIVAVTSGFLLRAIAGAVATSVAVSGPFLLVASFGALFLVVGKRYGEQLRLGDDAGTHRPTLAAYTPAFLTQLLSVSLCATLVTYAMWAFTLEIGEGGGIPWAAVSVLPFAVAMMRAAQLVSRGDGADPADLLHDDGLKAAAAATLVLVLLAVYVR